MTLLEPEEQALLHTLVEDALAAMRPAKKVHCDELHHHREACLVRDEQSIAERTPLVALKEKLELPAVGRLESGGFWHCYRCRASGQAASKPPAETPMLTASVSEEALIGRLVERLESVFHTEAIGRARKAVAWQLEEGRLSDEIRQTVRSEVRRILADGIAPINPGETTKTLEVLVSRAVTPALIEERVSASLYTAIERQAEAAVKAALSREHHRVVDRLEAALTKAASAFGESVTEALTPRSPNSEAL